MAKDIKSPSSEPVSETSHQPLPGPKKRRVSKPRTPIDKNTTPEPKLTYEERSKYFLEEFDKRCTENKVPVAIAFLLDPKTPDKPIIYSRGHVYKQAQAGCELAKLLKQQLLNSEDLSI